MRTLVYTVHEPPTPALDRVERAEGMEFVRDGFSTLAAALPPLWMVMNRLWLTLLLYLLVSMGASLALAAVGVDKYMIGLIYFAANVILGFEAASLQRWTLGRRGWSEVGTVVGRNRAECERRFFDQWLDQQPLLRRVAPSAPPTATSVRPAKIVQSAAMPAQQTAAGAFGPGGEADFVPVHDDGTTRHRSAVPARALWRRLLRR